MPLFHFNETVKFIQMFPHFTKTFYPYLFSPTLLYQVKIQEIFNDSLGVGRLGDQIPVGERFSAPVQNGPVAHSAYCTVGTGSLPE